MFKKYDSEVSNKRAVGANKPGIFFKNSNLVYVLQLADETEFNAKIS